MVHFVDSEHSVILSFLKSQGIPLKLFLDVVSSSPSDNVVTRVASMFSWGLKLHVHALKPLGLVLGCDQN